ncbi:hypothetical protein D2Q93_12050 [Alicyclobacillaceae bacterium I2511]|nr:hypothetical protein D2Q93_12050 [Alicyclobacillaceae bacterium I2511]
MSGQVRPHQTRRAHLQAVARARRRQRQRRRARIRRIRVLRLLLSMRFWMRTATTFAVLIGVAFWAKFALVYNIPSYVQQGSLVGVVAYVTVKPWWFGPPVFDLDAYTMGTSAGVGTDDYGYLLLRLDRYQSIVTHPEWVWVLAR